MVSSLLDLLTQRCGVALGRLPYVYLLEYAPDLAGTEILRRAAHDFLITYSGSRLQLRRWKEALVLLFTPQGPRNTARWLAEHSRDPLNALASIGVEGQLLAGKFVRQVTREAAAATAKAFPANLDLCLQLLIDESDRPRFLDVVCQAASLWIPRADSHGSEEIKSRLQRFFVKHLGDPRWPGERMRWGGVSEEARRIMTRWLAKEDITFFFEMLSQAEKHSAWQHRQEFWEAYLPYIDATWVVLSPDVRAKMGKQVEERIASGACGEFTGSNGGRSMLVIEMKGWVFLEWTHTGGCRGWPKDEFHLPPPQEQPQKGPPWHYSPSKVNSMLWTCQYYQRHYGSENYKWQMEFSAWLAGELGLPRVI